MGEAAPRKPDLSLAPIYCVSSFDRNFATITNLLLKSSSGENYENDLRTHNKVFRDRTLFQRRNVQPKLNIISLLPQKSPPEPRRTSVYKAMANPPFSQARLFTSQPSNKRPNSPPNSSSTQKCITYFPSSQPSPSPAPFPFRSMTL